VADIHRNKVNNAMFVAFHLQVFMLRQMFDGMPKTSSTISYAILLVNLMNFFFAQWHGCMVLSSSLIYAKV
jgi:hypothetical protein